MPGLFTVSRPVLFRFVENSPSKLARARERGLSEFWPDRLTQFESGVIDVTQASYLRRTGMREGENASETLENGVLEHEKLRSSIETR